MRGASWSRARVLAAIGRVILAASIGLTAPAIVRADDVVVVVRLRRLGDDRAEATVMLRDADGVVGTCTTVEGTCEIRGVPPGRHTVSATDARGNETPGRPVMIPPGGKVSLFVAVP
jgi:hypothetical protein